MPIYEYKCRACDKTFEELVLSEGGAKKVVCPDCGGRKVERVPSVFAAHAAPERAAPPRGGCGHCGQTGTCPMAGD